MKKLINHWGFYLLALLVIASSGRAEIDLQQGKALSLQMFVSKALSQDQEFIVSLQQYLQSTYSVLSAQEIADWTLSANVRANHFEATSSSGLDASDSENLAYDLSVQKLFLETGTQLTLSHSNTFSKQPESADASSLLTTSATESSSPKVTLSIMQPLLKNAFGLSSRYPVVLAKLQRQSARLDTLEAWENRIAELEKEYFTWISHFETIVAYREIIRENEILKKQVQAKVKTGVSEEKDLVQTEESLLNYQSQLVRAESDYINQRLKIAYLMAGRVVPDKTVWEIKSETSTAYQVPIKSATDISIKGLRTLKKLEYLREQQIRQKEIATNTYLPSLDLIGEYSVKGQEENLNGGYDSIGDQQDYTILLQASMPLGRVEARGDDGQADAALEEIRATIQVTERNLSLSVRQLYEQIRRTQEQLKIQAKLVAAAQRKFELDEENYEIGRRDIYYLIESQNGQVNAQLNSVQLKIQLYQLKIDYLSSIDRLLPNYPGLLQKLKAGKKRGSGLMCPGIN